jgi:hypothetical protein
MQVVKTLFDEEKRLAQITHEQTFAGILRRARGR